MAITRAQAEQILVKRLGGWMTEAGLEVTSAGGNKDLNDALGYATRKVGGTVASVTNVTDSDLAGISSDDYDALLDVAEWRALTNLARGLGKVDTRVGPLAQSFSQLRRDVLEAAKEKRAQIENDHSGLLGATVEAGVITLDLALKGDDVELSDE